MRKEFKVKCKDCQVGEPYIMNPRKKVLCEGKIRSAGRKRLCSVFMAKSLRVPQYLMKDFIDKIHYRLKWMTGKEVIKNNKTAEKRELVVNEGGKD